VSETWNFYGGDTTTKPGYGNSGFAMLRRRAKSRYQKTEVDLRALSCKYMDINRRFTTQSILRSNAKVHFQVGVPITSLWLGVGEYPVINVLKELQLVYKSPPKVEIKLSLRLALFRLVPTINYPTRLPLDYLNLGQPSFCSFPPAGLAFIFLQLVLNIISLSLQLPHNNQKNQKFRGRSPRSRDKDSWNYP
jgi:hypothetical protein